MKTTDMSQAFADARARGEAALIGTIPIGALPAGTYRVMDGKLYRVEPGLPPSLDTRDAEIATLRTRAEQAEAALVVANEAHARHAADRSREVTELHRAHERALRRAEHAEAERDEARALKVPPTVDELNAALMRAAVARVERDVATARAEQAEAERDEARAALAKVRDAAKQLYTACNGMRRDEEAIEAIEALGDVLHALGGDK